MNSESLGARRYLAGLTFVLVALTALLAFAGVAAATPGTGFGVVADDYPAQLDGVPEGKHELSVPPLGPIECEAPVVDQTAYGPLGTHTGLEAESFAGQSCYNNKGGKLAIDMHGCTFSFELGGSLSAGETEGNFDIVCPPGEHMTIQLPLFPCVLNVFEQKNLAARLHNQGEVSRSKRKP